MKFKPKINPVELAAPRGVVVLVEVVHAVVDDVLLAALVRLVLHRAARLECGSDEKEEVVVFIQRRQTKRQRGRWPQ
jgi:type IV secretory pathway VirB3-like protein